MMLELAVRNLMLADADLTALVGRRIRAYTASQRDDIPHVVYSATTETIKTFGGAASFRRALVVITSVARSYKACVEMSDEVRRIFDGYSGIQDGVQIIPSFFEDENDPQEGMEPGTERPVFVRTQNYRMLYRTAT